MGEKKNCSNLSSTSVQNALKSRSRAVNGKCVRASLAALCRAFIGSKDKKATWLWTKNGYDGSVTAPEKTEEPTSGFAEYPSKPHQ